MLMGKIAMHQRVVSASILFLSNGILIRFRNWLGWQVALTSAYFFRAAIFEINAASSSMRSAKAVRPVTHESTCQFGTMRPFVFPACPINTLLLPTAAGCLFWNYLRTGAPREGIKGPPQILCNNNEERGYFSKFFVHEVFKFSSVSSLCLGEDAPKLARSTCYKIRERFITRKLLSTLSCLRHVLTIRCGLHDIF